MTRVLAWTFCQEKMNQHNLYPLCMVFPQATARAEPRFGESLILSDTQGMSGVPVIYQ